METVSLCVSILSLVVSAISLGIALESRKKTAYTFQAKRLFN